MRRLAAALLLLAVSVPARADDAGAMQAVANGFYGAYGTMHPSDGIPDATQRLHLAPFLTPRLNKMLADAAAAQTRFAAKVKGAPPLIEGDLFSSLFEGASGWTVGTCSAAGKTGKCAVALRHQDPGQKPTAWSDTLLMTDTAAGWKIDDIAYGAGFSFGNTGLMSQTLQAVMAEAQ